MYATQYYKIIYIFFLTYCSVFFSITFCYQLPRIIILNGSSCVGKSSVARSLQKLLPNYSVVSYDEYRINVFVPQAKRMGFLPEDYVFTGPLAFSQDFRAHFKRLSVDEAKHQMNAWSSFIDTVDDQFYQYIEDLSSKGSYVIVDAIIFSSKKLNAVKKLDSTKMFAVFIHASVDKIMERVNKRNICGQTCEMRFFNRILYNYPYYYRLQKKFEHASLCERLSLVTLKSICLKVNLNDSSLPTENKLYEHFIQALQVSDRAEEAIGLIPYLTYDCYINTNNINPEEAAIEIQKTVESRTYLISRFPGI